MAAPARKAQRLSQKGSGGLAESPSKRTWAESADEDSTKQAMIWSSSRPGSSGSVEEEISTAEFKTTGIDAFLDLDPRPTFVLKLEAGFSDVLVPDFVNESFLANSQLRDAVAFTRRPELAIPSPRPAYSGFQLWIRALALDEPVTSKHFTFCGFVWTGFKVQQRWLVISGLETQEESASGSEASPQSASATLQSTLAEGHGQEPLTRAHYLRTISNDSLISEALPPSFVTPGTPDWTLAHPLGDLSPHAIFARSVDWSATPLGDMRTW